MRTTLRNKHRMRGTMPKTARFTLTWSGEQDLYRLYEHGHLLFEADSASWFTWLITHISFSFRGRNGSFNLLKETRKKSSEGYWYAYQRQGKRIAKRYVGRSVSPRYRRASPLVQNCSPLSSLSSRLLGWIEKLHSA